MSCFDTIYLACPHCHERTSIQSKAGDCDMRDYEQLAVPVQIAVEEQRIPHACTQCGKQYFLFAQAPRRVPVTGVKELHERVDLRYQNCEEEFHDQVDSQ